VLPRRHTPFSRGGRQLPHLDGISTASRRHLDCISTASRLSLSQLFLGCFSAVSRLSLGCLSAASRLPLGYLYLSRLAGRGKAAPPLRQRLRERAQRPRDERRLISGVTAIRRRDEKETEQETEKEEESAVPP